jgi:predicted transcriptional regulator of viral defense system
MVAERQRALDLLRTGSAVRTSRFRKHGVPSRTIRGLMDENVVERVERGLYVLTDYAPNQHQTLVEVCAADPRGAICLESATRFHDLGEANPYSVWQAMPRGAGKPSIKSVSIELVHMGGP